MVTQKSNWKYIILGTLIIIAVISAAPLSFAADDLVQAYKTEEKACKKMAHEHENMEGWHKLMFKAWQEKSQPILKEDEGLSASCQEAVLTLKDISEKITETERKSISPNESIKDEDKQTDLMVEYEKAMNMITMIVLRHKTLKEKHEELFHSMMGH